MTGPELGDAAAGLDDDDDATELVALEDALELVGEDTADDVVADLADKLAEELDTVDDLEELGIADEAEDDNSALDIAPNDEGGNVEADETVDDLVEELLAELNTDEEADTELCNDEDPDDELPYELEAEKLALDGFELVTEDGDT